MAISVVWIEEGCIGCGLAEAICPEVFSIRDNSMNCVMKGINLSEFEDKIKEAANECPVKVIKYE